MFLFSDNGIVMTCGDGSFGALGHGDWNSSARPKLIEQLLRYHMSAVRNQLFKITNISVKFSRKTSPYVTKSGT